MSAQRVGTEVALDFLTTESGQGEDERASRRRLQVCAPTPESSPPSFIRSRAGSLASSVLGDMVRRCASPGLRLRPHVPCEVFRHGREVSGLHAAVAAWLHADKKNCITGVPVLSRGCAPLVESGSRINEAGAGGSASARSGWWLGPTHDNRHGTRRPADARDSCSQGLLARQDKLALSPAPILEEVPKASRVCLEYEHVSAWVPATLGSPGLLPDMSWLWACARGGKTADRGGGSDSASDSSERPPKHRQVSHGSWRLGSWRFHHCFPACCMPCCMLYAATGHVEVSRSAAYTLYNAEQTAVSPRLVEWRERPWLVLGNTAIAADPPLTSASRDLAADPV